MEYPYYAADAVLVIAVLVGWLTYNRLVALDERCDTAFADVDVLLKHRHTLIPQLVEAVRGFMGHERDVLGEVARARAAAMSAAGTQNRLQAETQVGQTLASLISIVEKYPDLHASAHFRELRGSLTDAENRIAAARRFYNLAVNEFNATLRQFPGNLVGGVMRLSRRAAFDLGLDRAAIDQPATVRF